MQKLIQLNDGSQWKIKIVKNNIGNSMEFSCKVEITKSNGAKKIVFKLDANLDGDRSIDIQMGGRLIDIQIIGFFKSINGNKSAILTYIKLISIEGEILYSPYFIGCKLTE